MGHTLWSKGEDLFYMSKDLPYFKFFPNEWLTGDITLESMETQGVFVNVCAIYWSKECRVALAGLEQRYGVALARLLKSGIIKEKDGFAVINFLDEQWNELYNRHQINVENGRKGGLKSSVAKAPLKHIDKIRREEIREDKIRIDKKKEELVFPFSSNEFLSVWNVLIKEKKWRKKSFSALQASLLQLGKYPESVSIEMMKNTIAGEWQGLFEIKNITQNGTAKTNGRIEPSTEGIIDKLRKANAAPNIGQ